MNSNVCHVNVSAPGISNDMNGSFVYGPPALSNRHLLWDWIEHKASIVNCPWLIIGDFNQIFDPKDKISLNSGSSGMDRFVSCVENSALHEVI